MATNLNIDIGLLTEAQTVGCFRTKRETVNSALSEFVQHHKQLALLDFEGKLDFVDGYDHKALRGRKVKHGDR